MNIFNKKILQIINKQINKIYPKLVGKNIESSIT
jgi:hypothetical protein